MATEPDEVITLPKCPHCGAELPAVSLFNWMQPAWVILCVHCPACQTVLHMQVVPMAVQAESPLVDPPWGRGD